jgi:glucokinase
MPVRTMEYTIDKDERIVMTLDAGGTNFVFSAIQGNKQILNPIRLYPNSKDLNKCLETIITGFEIVKKVLKEVPVAISFAFPGPSDYPNGIIGDLPNLPAFRGGVALVLNRK